ncbi:MAG: AAA family ATPase [Chloroflexaceae bacterium]|nr:AAA family ATPase [Chloroflexaceae bacterium]
MRRRHRGQLRPPWHPAWHLRPVGHLDTLAPVRYLIDEVLPHNDIITLYGGSGTGKSFLALDLALTVAQVARWSMSCRRRWRPTAPAPRPGASTTSATGASSSLWTTPLTSPTPQRLRPSPAPSPRCCPRRPP